MQQRMQVTTLRQWGMGGVALAGLIFCRPALASSELQHGIFSETDPAGQSFHDKGACDFVTGPRTGMAADQFQLTAGDSNAPGDTELKVTGTFTARSTAGGKTVYTLASDPASAGEYIETVLRAQTHDSSLTFLLTSLTAGVVETAGRAQCTIMAKGMVTGSSGTAAPASLSFAGQGSYFPGAVADSGAHAALPAPRQAGQRAQTIDNNPPCPTTLPQSQALAPLGLDPVPGKCGTASCLINFAGYQWWTSFQYYGAPGNPVFPYGGYYYNGGLRTIFAPKNASLGADGLHLKAMKQDLGAGPVPAGAEVVLMFNPDGTQANLGYGDYLVTATVKTASDWNSLDPNVAFGLFPYERIGDGNGGTADNPSREIDLAEVSTWGKYPANNCPYTGFEEPLCSGNAQFTLQIYNKLKGNLHRYTIASNVKTITLVMKWQAEGQPVTFQQYNGAYTLSSLPAKPDNAWTTSAARNKYVPAPGCGRFHMNLWFGNFPAGVNNINPGPATYPQEVVVNNFQFQPATP